MAELEESKSIVIQGNDIYGTLFLEISSYYYISHKTLRFVLNNISADAGFKECLYWLSMAVEYDELPVRHNEEFLNVEISKDVKFPAEETFEKSLPLWDPHIKVFLLLQAYFSCIELPVADYYQDTLTVLDQTLRLTQAYIDTAAQFGYLGVVKSLIQLLWSLKQGCMPGDDFVTVLPGFTKRSLLKEGSEAKISLKMLNAASGPEINKIINSKDFKKLSKNIFDVSKKKELIDTVKKLPFLDEDSLMIKRNPEEKKLTLVANHLNKSHEHGFHVYCASYKKKQKESWFLLGFIGEDLKILKRCMPNKKGEIRVTVDLDSETILDTNNIKFELINDALDISYIIPLV